MAEPGTLPVAEMSRPFVHLFATARAVYVYDVNTREVLRVDEVLGRMIGRLAAGASLEESAAAIRRDGTPEPKIGMAVASVRELREAGLLSANRPVEVTHPATAVLEGLLSSSIEQLTLQVTTSCNLRCSYCVYSGKYETREHGQERMTLRVATDAIDFYVRRSWNRDRLAIGFYGGEPLLNFELVARCIQYARDNYPHRCWSFNLTTNGTLIEGEVARALTANDVAIHVSLDGPSTVHDKNRCFASGRGSYTVVRENLARLKQMAPEYYRKRVSFGVVLDPETDFCELSRFYAEDDAVLDHAVLADFPSSEYRKDDRRPAGGAAAKFGADMERERQRYFLYRAGRIAKADVSPIVFANEEKVDKATERRMAIKRRHLPARYHPSGPCIPGMRRLFVTAAGDFFPCEKVSERSSPCRLGDLRTGFDMAKAHQLLSVARTTADSCRDCWAADFCFLCAMFSDGLTRLDPEKRLSRCESVKRSAEKGLRRYCVYRELGLADE